MHSQLTGTFSIVARDAATGDLGVAVESRYFAVGTVVPWAEAGVGAIATQAAVNRDFGPWGLTLLREDLQPQEALDRLLQGDEKPEVRQVGIIDRKGRTADHTGPECQPWAGAASGRDFSAQGNILVGPQVIADMAAAFEDSAAVAFAERLMRALEAAQQAGGDARGQQSAALLVVSEKAGIPGHTDRLVDLRVDDHQKPIEELRRMFDILCDMRGW
jgi:uncharacterized Ntn-hydrolase superfamily protein